MSDAPFDVNSDASDTPTSARIRRSVYCFGVTIVCLLAAFCVTYFRTGSVAEHMVDGCFTLAELVAISYLSVSAVDRSGILAHIGARISSGPVPTPPPGAP